MSDTEAQGLIDSARFRETMTEQQERAKASPEGRRLVQRAKIRLLENQLKEATVGEFTILCDEAVTRRGDGKAPSPLQYFVAAIGFWMFSQLTRYASHLDIVIEEAEMDIRMAYDTMGKLLLEDVSPAAESVTYVFDIKSPAAPEQISELIYLIERGCHTMNTIKAPTPVSAKVLHNGVEVPVREQEPSPAQA